MTDTDKPPVSVLVITAAEPSLLRQCLLSAQWAREIVVVDAGSSPAARAICEQLATCVINHDWEGYGRQRQFALEQAQQQWVLMLDTDEIVPDALASEIAATVAHPQAQAGFFIPRLNHFAGRPLRHGGNWPDCVLRLFLRSAARYPPSPIHERPTVEGNLGRLRQPLLHYSYADVADAVARLNRYSTLAAQHGSAGLWPTPLKALCLGLCRFIGDYFLRLGFLDGYPGLVMAALKSHYALQKQFKAWELRRMRTQPSKDSD